MKRSAIISLTLFAAIAVPTAPASAKQFAVYTYHYDNLRTGCNPSETKLTPANVRPTSFGVLAQIALDDQVDAQPLVVPNQQITAGRTPGTYQVVYVATEGNTIYAINAVNGAVLLIRHLGPPVPVPLGCGNNGPNVGITGTPVIDVVGQTLYVVAYTKLISGIPTYKLFALNLKNLTNQAAPVTVAASHTLSNGTTTFHFNATYQRQRAAMLGASGIIYAAFGSFCDFSADKSRGWLLGWRGGTLAPLAANRLTNRLAMGNYFLSAIWMSGYGIAAASSGNLFFATGNSAPGTYDGVRNIQESVVKVGPQLVNVLGIFTPADKDILDMVDGDLSSGGVLLLPQQPGPIPFLAVTAGKEGTMYLLNRANLGGFTPGGPDHVLDTKSIGACWCGPSYFTGPDGVGRVVSSGRSGGEGSNLAQITVWKVKTSPPVAFVPEGAASPVASGQDGGTFSTVSSNGTQAGTAIIWAVGRPLNSSPAAVNLYAFAAAPSSGTLPLLFSSQAGSWGNIGGDADIVPVVANGKVFVASNKQLTIFGLGGHPFVAPAAAAATAAAPDDAHLPPHAITGVLEHADGPVLTLRTRTGAIARVDGSEALRNGQTGVLVLGNAYTAQGTYDATGALHAQAVWRAKPSPAIWPPDR